MRTIQIRAAGLLLALALLGCQTKQVEQQKTACPPAKPKLAWTLGQNNGICLSGEDTADLLDYLDAMDRCM